MNTKWSTDTIPVVNKLNEETIKDGTEADVIRDVNAVKKLLKRLEKAEKVCNALRDYLGFAKKPYGPVTDALCLWMEFTSKHCKGDK